MKCKEHKRDRIVRAAIEIVEEKGVHALSLRAVAKRCSMALGSLSHHFVSRDELIEECLEGYYGQLDELQKRYVAQAREAENVEQVAEAAVRALFRWCLAHRGILRLRVFSTAEQRGLNERRFKEVAKAFLNATARFLGQNDHRTKAEIRTFCYLFTNGIGRSLAVDKDDQMQWITGTDSIAACHDTLEEFYVGLLKAYLFAPEQVAT